MNHYKQLVELSCNGYCNTDKQGRPVYIMRVSFLKAKEMFSIYS